MGDRPFFTIGRQSFEKNSGYKSTAHALAEIVDNAAEEDARHISIIIKENRNPKYLMAIGVMDDGNGMDPELLQAAVCERSGSRFDRMSSTGVGRRKYGKYGIGLPKASISQSNRFAVWSWQNSRPSKAYCNRIDITDEDWINDGCLVADSVAEPVPSDWINASGNGTSPSGTFVLWDILDGHTWRTSRGLVKNLDFLLGRIYRKLLSIPEDSAEDIPLTIRVVVVDENMNVIDEHDIIPNDPLYLTPNTGCPEPDYNPEWVQGQPMFDQTINEALEIDIQFPDGGSKSCEITIRGSVSHQITRTVLNQRVPGSFPHGKHAAKNQGVSFLREGREVILDTRWCTSDPRERWWGLEIDSPHELDDLLGVSNNKQSLDRLLNVFGLTHADLAEDGETTQQTLERLRQEDKKYAFCVELGWLIQSKVNALRKAAEAVVGPKLVTKPPDDGDDETEEQVEEDTDATPEDAAEDIASSSEEEEPEEELSEEERKKAIEDYLSDSNVPTKEIKRIMARLVDRGLKYVITYRPGLGSSLFSVDQAVDAKLISLNTDHPAYKSLLDMLTSGENVEGATTEELVDKMTKAKTTILLLLEAWAKLETDAQGDEKTALMDAREDWGRILRRFVKEMNERNEVSS